MPKYLATSVPSLSTQFIQTHSMCALLSAIFSVGPLCDHTHVCTCVSLCVACAKCQFVHVHTYVCVYTKYLVHVRA